jgi:hypothetical protein
LVQFTTLSYSPDAATTGGRVPTLFSYCVRYDGGSAPNPFGGVCTLVICKPAIRRVAQVGDWIVGTGSKVSPVGDTSGRMIYAMRVTEKLTMAEYDQRSIERLRLKIPDVDSPRLRDQVGDAIWHYRSPDEPPTARPGDHDEGNRKTDLGGRYSLLASEFVYFGKNAPMLPDHLLGLVKQGPGHRAAANAHLRDGFLAWMKEQPRGVKGEPQEWDRTARKLCGSSCARHDEEDEHAGCD